MKVVSSGDGAAQAASIASGFWDWQRREYPLAAAMAGEAMPDAILFREAPADHDRRRAEAGARLADLEGADEAGMAAADRATVRLVRRELRTVVELHDVLAHLRPSLFPVGPEFTTVFFANSTSVCDAESASLYAARAATLPGFIADAQACLAAGLEAGLRYPRATLRAAIENLSAALASPVAESAWMSPFRRSLVAADPAVAARAEEVRATVEQRLRPALAALAAFMEQRLMPAARESAACAEDRLGPEFYQALARNFTNGDMTPDAIHALGLDEVARLASEMEEVASDAGFAGDLPGYRRFLTSDPRFVAPSAEALRQEIEVLSKRIDRWIPSLFGRIPRMTYGVESIPAAMSERMPPCYAQPNPADGSGPGVHWVSGLPHKCPRYLHVALALHEGWPGHLMHIALMQEMESLPAFRRLGAVKYTACLEGWAMYCEGLGTEMGLYATPDQRFGRLDMEMWRALRLVVDTGIHWLGWSRERAAELMAANLTLSRAAVEAEVDRYIGMPGQALAYQTGALAFRDMRRRAERTLGAAFRARDFHDALMAAGPATLPVLDDLMQDWLDRRAAPAGRAPEGLDA